MKKRSRRSYQKKASEGIGGALLCRWENAGREVRSDEGHGGVVTRGGGSGGGGLVE